ncbi:MAG: hypothetical protein U9O96_02535 [Candidatus Thermoplasmatota archaeon]|nr:hypothetical protein [Candidatus Thermoplasmatota archaeon]
MMKIVGKRTWLISIFVVMMMILTPLLSLSYGGDVRELPSGFKGVTWKKVVPLNKVTLVKFDENSYIDDFAYMAAIPSSVFYDEKTDKVYSNPLLFYEDEREFSKEELSLNGRQGLNYFMEDWMSYCGRVGKIVSINIGNERPWNAKNYTYITSEDPYEIAENIALSDWSYADSAVVAVLGDIEGKGNETNGTVQGTISSKEIKEMRQSAMKQDSIAPQYNDFYVGDEYKYIKADLTWPSVSWLPALSFALTLGILQGGLTVPSADPDLHLYCDYEGGLTQVASSQNWNIMSGPWEHCESYVYAPGNWKTSVVDIPTKGIIGDRHGTLFERLKDIVTGRVTYNIDLVLYPGEEVELPDTTPFMCRNADFELTWSGNGKLGLIILDENNVPVGEAVAENVSKQQTLHLDQLGEGKYKAVIVQLSAMDRQVDYTLEYSWQGEMKKSGADYIMNAAEGSIIASLTNSPLLYTPPDKLQPNIEKIIKKLGIKDVYFVNIGDYSSAEVRDGLNRVCDIKKEYNDLISIYKEIRECTDENDIVFSTIDPWTYWLVEKLKPEGEKKGSLYIGPAAYLAAHHGAPLIAVDMHPPISRAVTWHNNWWKKHAIRDDEPNVAAMYLTSREVYDFLGEVGLDKPGERESIITVAGQFDIGIPWDRSFVGAANAGRLIGTPVDTSYWACRNAFYPAVIFANPALNEKGITLINGSKSTRKATGMLDIIKPSQDEKFNYPILNSFMTYCYRFNERASKYWGFNYTTATGVTPFDQPSTNPIDSNILAKYGKYGSYWPDMTEPEVVPFYLEKSGYEIAFTTNFSATMEDLNRGVIAWFETTHGWHANSGSIAFWNSYGAPGFAGINISLPTVEPNPWRGYEIYLPGWLDGSTEEPDVLSQSKKLGIDIIPAKLSDQFMSRYLPVIKNSGYDGVVITVIFGRLRTKDATGYEIDEALDNIHSAGFNAGSCLISNTYLHLTLIRHGSVYQVIDPWETSWYGSFATEMFARDIALGKSVGEAYTNSILHTGIGYLTKQWWWDIKENMCYFGDPDLQMWSPQYGWGKPDSMAKGMVDGHAPFGATEYPHEAKEGEYSIYIVVAIILLCAAAGSYFGIKYKKTKN